MVHDRSDSGPCGVDPSVHVLCSDLVWRPCGSLKMGEEIIAFDANPTFGNGKAPARRYRVAAIKSVAPVLAPCSRVSTDAGGSVVASNDHAWLVWVKNRNVRNTYIGHAPPSGRKNLTAYPRTAGLAWKRTGELSDGDELAFLAEPWTTEETRAAGWLAGMYDGEGCLSRSTGDTRIPAWKVNVSQNDGQTMDRLKRELAARRFSLYVNRRKCSQLVIIGGWAETLRFLGAIRPARLLEKLPRVVESMPMLQRDNTFARAKVMSVDPIGVRRLAGVDTTRGSFIAGGHLLHGRVTE